MLRNFEQERISAGLDCWIVNCSNFQSISSRVPSSVSQKAYSKRTSHPADKPVDKNIEIPSRISRIGSNLCSFVWFAGKKNVISLEETEYLHEYCADIGASMIRSARAERVGEAYGEYARETYVDQQLTESAENVGLFNGGFEVAFVGRRFCLLKDWRESGRRKSQTVAWPN